MVFFDWDRSNLTAQAVDTVRQAAAAYKSRGSASISAVGHTDTSGSPQYNMALSLRRANAVKGQLVREPQNRRVEISVGGLMTSTATVFSDPASYCKALSDKWRQYRTSMIQSPESAAMYQCEQGNYAAGIPVLEDALIQVNIPLPAPGYRWPGRLIGPS